MENKRRKKGGWFYKQMELLVEVRLSPLFSCWVRVGGACGGGACGGGAEKVSV